MSIKKLMLTGVITGSVCLSGCASLVDGTTQSFKVQSDPSGADVKVDQGDVGKTPIALNLKRGMAHKLTVSLPGYQSQTLVLTKHINGWVVGNVLFGGLIGLVIDASDGAMYSLSPSEAKQYLASHHGHYDAKKDAFFVVLSKNVKTASQKIGQLKKN